MSEFLKCLPDFIQNLVLAENILKVTLRVPKVSAATVHSMSIEGEIEFENVSFTYPSRQNQLVLDNFNLQVHPGKSLAITGASGSGKSTIVSFHLQLF
jgi:ABC-type bacteriocin/lantibiotic exporter with double-glycine peptidase domain